MPVSYESRYSVEPNYIQSLPAYLAVSHNIEMSGAYQYVSKQDGTVTAISYNPYLIVLFRQRELPVWDAIEQQDAIIDAGRYFNSFVAGFAKGVAEFDRRFVQPQTPTYTIEEYVEGIQRFYYGDGAKRSGDYCLKMIQLCPITLERSQFERIGFWSALTFHIELVMKDRPQLFGATVGCVNNVIPESKSEENKSEQQREYAPPFIVVLKQEQIFRTLKPYVAAGQHEDFKRVLSGETVDDRIWVKTQSNSLVYVFARVLFDNTTDTGNTSTQLAVWLSERFSFGKSHERAVSYHSAYDVIRGKEIVSKEKQLVLR